YPVRVQEGGHGSTWILVDLYEVVVHIFTAEAREQYKLEKLWGDQPFVSFEGDSQPETKE
ncbi:MAG: RsfS/YbeB/iojap family protein, partial [Erysipelotrichaceae bacterium]|nr:RsfS/YbeB/iojap family protein [Erysipelotrichaceae bacterium]